MFDTDLMAAILKTLPRKRKEGEGVTAQELDKTSPLSINTIRRRLKAEGLEAVRMVDFDGETRLVYVNKGTE